MMGNDYSFLPSGAETTLVSLLSKLNNFEISISHTTRNPRPNETLDKDYYCNWSI